MVQGRPDNRLLLFVCVILMAWSMYMTINGRGVLAILQGILGFMLGIEGYWGASKFNQSSVRDLLKWMFFFSVASVVLGILHLTTVSEFCKANETVTDDEISSCKRSARIQAWLILLVGGIGVPPLVFAVGLIFYRKLTKINSTTIFTSEFLEL